MTMTEHQKDNLYQIKSFQETISNGFNVRTEVNQKVLRYLGLSESLYMAWTIDPEGRQESYLKDALLDEMVTSYIRFMRLSNDNEAAMRQITENFLIALDVWQQCGKEK